MAGSASQLDLRLTGVVKLPPVGTLWPLGSTSVQRRFGRVGLYEGDLEARTCRKLCEDGQVTETIDALTCAPVPSGMLGLYDVDLEVERCTKLCEGGQVNEAVDVLNLLVLRGIHIPNNLFYRVVKRCITQKDLPLGRRVHALSVVSGYESNAFLANHLICMYASHGSLVEAMQVFSKVSAPDAYMWASIIFAYAKHGQPTQAIGLYRQMCQSALKPDNRIFVAVLKACACAGDLATGKDVHAHILANGVKSDIFVQTCLVDMYAKCGSLRDAQRLFDSLSQKSVVTWTAIIAGYAQQGMGEKALSLYSTMQQEGITPPDSVTFVCLLQACASVGVAALQQGTQLHGQIEEQGLEANLVVGAALVNMYAKCGNLEDAQRAFDRLPQKDVVTWNAMIAAYAQQEMIHKALRLYRCMQKDGVTSADSVTFVCLLQACAKVGAAALHHGKYLHAQIKQLGLHAHVAVGSSLVNMYAKCRSLEEAQTIFDELVQKDVTTWNALLAGYAQQGMGRKALSVYSCMSQQGITTPDRVTFVCLLEACATVGVRALHQGKQVHVQIDKQGLQDDAVLGISLIDMYAKCGSLEDARRVFDRLPHRDIVMWTSIIAGYVQQGRGQEALNLYTIMQQQGTIPPDAFIYASLLQACASVAALQEGKQLHAQLEEQGHQADAVVGASLVNMYAKCGSLEDARRVFDGLPQKNVVTWNTMIAGYAQQGMGQEALCLYTSMRRESVISPDYVTFVCLLQACASVAALPLGKELHSQIEERGLHSEVIVGNSLVNMYAKCGSMVDAQQAFHALPERDVMSWNAIIAGYARQGDSEVVIDMVHMMRQDGIEPDGITFLSVLTVCSHVGAVDKGLKYFEDMGKDYGITPTIEHHTCMVDLLGRAGHLDGARWIAETMPYQPNAAVWTTLLGACRKWSNVQVGQEAFESAVRLDEYDAAAYVLMSNIYADAQMWQEAKEMQGRRVKFGAWKEPGRSWWTDKWGIVHSFAVGDRKHPESEGIYARLEQLVLKMKEGYVPHLASS